MLGCAVPKLNVPHTFSVPLRRNSVAVVLELYYSNEAYSVFGALKLSLFSTSTGFVGFQN